MIAKRSIGRPFADPARDSREFLINAAIELFAENGVAATTFATIARRAGLTPAMVHYHFADRDQLLDAVVEGRFVPLLHSVWDPVVAGSAPSELIAGFVHRLIEQIVKSPWVPSIWMREILNDRGMLFSRIVSRLPFEKLVIVGSAIARGQKAGELNRDVEPFLVVFSALGLVMVHMATMHRWAAVFDRSPLTTKAVERHITGLLLRGVTTRRGEQIRVPSRSKRHYRSTS